MSRLPPKSDTPWYVRLFLYLQKKKYGVPLEPTLLWVRTPRVFFGFLMIQWALNRKSSPLDPLLRALITVKVSQTLECNFCIDMNTGLFLDRGGLREKIDAIDEYKNSPQFSDEERCALEYAEAMTEGTKKPEDAVFGRLKTHFSDDAIVEMTALISEQNLSSRFNSALDAAAHGFCNRPPQ